LDKNFLADVDPSKGRFRSFLLASLRNFLSHEREKSRTLKRGGRTSTISLEIADGEEHYSTQPVDDMTPEAVYESRWATAVLDRSLERLHKETAASGPDNQFDHLKQYLTSSVSEAPYRQTAETLGTSEGAIKVAVHRLRKRFGVCLRSEIAETVANPADVDDEVRHLLDVIRP